LNIELRHLRYFLAIVESGNFSRAAEKLHISQPALSAQIKQLETEIGSHLFDRVGRQVRITESGETLVTCARKIMLELKEAQAALQELEGLATGHLIVGVVQTVNGYLIPRVTSLFLNKYPGVSLTVLELSATEIEGGVINGRLNLGISFTPSGIESIDEDTLFSENLVVITAKNHPLKRERTISIRSLANERLVTFPDGFWTRRLTNDLFASIALKPRIALETNTIQSILTAVRHSDMVTILPALALRLEEGKDLAMLNIKESAATRTLGFLWRKGANKKKSALAYAHMVRRETLIATRPSKRK
jgi:LysR family transcriptional regulator, cyn operon transcriptional activator